VRVTITTPRIMAIVACVLLIGLGGVSLRRHLTRERNTMAITTAADVLATSVPPIDAAAPTHTETATFALG